MTEPLNRESVARRINEAHAAAIGAAGQALEHARQAGELLHQVKQGLQHGQWLPWLAENVAVSARQAQKYMRLFENWDAIQFSPKYDPSSHLTITEALACLGTDQGEPSGNIAAELRARYSELCDSIELLACKAAATAIPVPV
jgi:hypothetical protein